MSDVNYTDASSIPGGWLPPGGQQGLQNYLAAPSYTQNDEGTWDAGSGSNAFAPTPAPGGPQSLPSDGTVTTGTGSIIDAAKGYMDPDVAGGATVSDVANGYYALRAQGYTPQEAHAQASLPTNGSDASTTLSPGYMRAVAQIESGGDPASQNKLGYKGLYQFSDSEWQKYGQGGDVFNAQDNTAAFVRKSQAEGQQFANITGHQPSDAESYLIHQQGVGGAAAHVMHPDQPAWQSMLSTAEGQQKGEGWAKRAITGNGGTLDMTSGQFAQHWSDQLNRRMGSTQSAAPAQQAAALDLSSPSKIFSSVQTALKGGADPEKLWQQAQPTLAKYVPSIFMGSFHDRFIADPAGTMQYAASMVPQQ